jgi:predicted RNase H-like HicB family nuclease
MVMHVRVPSKQPPNKMLEPTPRGGGVRDATRRGSTPTIAGYTNTGDYGVLGMKYKVVLKKSDEGFAVSCPGLPGCWSQGDTEREALANIQHAIREYFAVRDELLKDGDVREVEVAS